eukprot:3479376-Pleurochrysis_carterae.AAC.1
MWALLDSRAPGGANATPAEAEAETVPTTTANAQSTFEETKALPGNERREYLSGSMRASELNIVTYPGHTDADARCASVAEEAATYLDKKLRDVHGSSVARMCEGRTLPCGDSGRRLGRTRAWACAPHL